MHSFQLFSNQAAIDPTAYRENRIKQLKEAGGLGSSIRVFLCNLRFERMKPFDEPSLCDTVAAMRMTDWCGSLPAYVGSQHLLGKIDR